MCDYTRKSDKVLKKTTKNNTNIKYSQQLQERETIKIK